MRRLAALLVLGGGWVWSQVGCTKPGERGGGGSEALRIGKVARGDLVERVVLTGELRAGVAIELTTPKTDTWELTIRWIAEDGAVVKAGDRVLEFDNSAFTSGLEQKRMMAKEATMQFRATKDLSAMATVDKQFELRQQQLALDKATIRASVPADLQPQREAQERLLVKMKAEVAVAKAEKDLVAQKQTASLDERVKQIDLDKATRAITEADQSIGNLVLKAPRDGVVSVEERWDGRKYLLGDTTQPGETLITLPDLTKPMEVRADLSDVDDSRVAIDMTGTCTLDAYPREPLPCVVRELAPVARAKNPKSLRRAFAVKLELSKADPERMRPGMSVKVELLRPPTVNALLVPRGALVMTEVKGVTSAQVRLPGGELRAVVLGSCDAQRCVATTGVTEGESVAIGGSP